MTDFEKEALAALKLAANINPFGSVENAEARDAARRVLATKGGMDPLDHKPWCASLSTLTAKPRPCDCVRVPLPITPGSAARSADSAEPFCKPSADLEKAARMALEALEYYQHRKIEWDYSDDAAITALRQALEQPAQQHVSVMTVLHLKDRTEIGFGPASAGYDLPTGEYRLYTSPQRKPWVALTLDEKHALNDALNLNGRFVVIDVIEAKVRGKNE